MTSDPFCASQKHRTLGVAIMLFRMVAAFVRERHLATGVAMDLHLRGHRVFVHYFVAASGS